MQAVDLPHYGMILFSKVKIPEDLVPEVVKGLGGVILEEVRLADPPEVYRWPEGEPRPEQVLCVSKADPREYEVFKRPEVDLDRFEITAKSYDVLHSEGGWRTFLEKLKALEGVARNAVGVEPPDSPEDP